jgi:hypothetical protein
MSGTDPIAVFRLEAQELFDQMEQGLLDLAQNPGNQETDTQPADIALSVAAPPADEAAANDHPVADPKAGRVDPLIRVPAPPASEPASEDAFDDVLF